MIGGVAVAGRAGSGKSTLSRNLVAQFDRLGVHAEVVSFATELKREVWELYGLQKGDLGSREALIEHGERRRAEDPEYWVERALPAFQAVWAAGGLAVCDDLRRLPEFKWLCACGFYKVRVTAPLKRRRARLADQGLDADFALSDDPTEVDHEAWRFDSRFHLSTERHHREAAGVIAARVARRLLV